MGRGLMTPPLPPVLRRKWRGGARVRLRLPPPRVVVIATAAARPSGDSAAVGAGGRAGLGGGGTVGIAVLRGLWVGFFGLI